ncbi:hypothetical protein COO60DRAFT_199666 [Scenedesmus sp. NREL 46B-D3]|nr:hypothetical protein COO60DRAFT_199666 [Scenedesmus sp. NREL 46B-D3]
MKVAACALALLCLAVAAHAEIIGDYAMQQRSTELQSQMLLAAKASSNTTDISTNTTGSSDDVVDFSNMALPVVKSTLEDTEAEGTAAAAAVAPVTFVEAPKPAAGAAVSKPRPRGGANAHRSRCAH